MTSMEKTIANQLIEVSSVLEAVKNVLHGHTVSDFMASFHEVSLAELVMEDKAEMRYRITRLEDILVNLWMELENELPLSRKSETIKPIDKYLKKSGLIDEDGNLIDRSKDDV